MQSLTGCHYQRSPMEWINVDHKLPPISTWVLGLSQARGIYEVRRSGSSVEIGYKRTDWVLPHYMNEFMPITHWMPLPKVPDEVD